MMPCCIITVSSSIRPGKASSQPKEFITSAAYGRKAARGMERKEAALNEVQELGKQAKSAGCSKGHRLPSIAGMVAASLKSLLRLTGA
jgi:hypothetical protein